MPDRSPAPEAVEALREAYNDAVEAHALDRLDVGALLHAIREHLAALSAPRVEAWQPIETAPKDGTPIRLYHLSLLDEDFNPSGSCEAFWQQDFGWMGAVWDPQFDAWTTVEIHNATHWMPLPVPPETP